MGGEIQRPNRRKKMSTATADNLLDMVRQAPPRLYLIGKKDRPELSLVENECEQRFFNYEQTREVENMYRRFFGSDYKTFM